ncbi:hypothetical protein GA0115237_10884 [Streptomyces sp. ScaeMP-6W]|nr:hypothetical protein GA0115237_10884 [Streptomyces sp. ScaeMP-6W]
MVPLAEAWDSEWAELAGRITAFLPALPASEAARIVAGMTPAARTRIRDHLRLHPDALVSGASDAPRSIQALITSLAGAGITGVKAPSCLRCGRVRPLRRAVPGGRVCLGCEGVLAARGNTGPCCVCGETRPRPSNQRCASCQRAHISATRSCSTCGKPAALDPCTSCRPRPPARCALCETNAPVCARWPLGPVCKPCYREARIHPGTCPVCRNERVLIAFTDGRRVCGPCTGHGDPYACPRCACPRSYTVRGLCDRCTLQDELDAVLGPAAEAPDGQYARMRTALAECDQPRTALNWLRNSYSGRLLAGLAFTGRPLTHDDLETLARSGTRGDAQTIDYLREVLVAYQALPERDELPARIERHLARVVERRPEHALLLRPYVRWSLLPRARRAAHRRAGLKHRIRWAYTRINLAAAFLTAMQERGLALADVTQHEVDAWLASGPGTHYEVRDFVVWAARRGHSRDLLVPHRPKADPEGLDEDSHWELLQQCLTDTALPLEVRAAGAVLLLFGQHVTRIAALSADALATVDGHTVLILDRTPIRLPEPLALLLTKLTRQEPPGGWAVNSPRRWLFPGTRPGRHLSSTVLARRLTAHHIPVRPARTTALVQLAQDLPPAILAPMLGLHIITAQQWRRRAVTDWTAYLEARRGEPVGRQATREADSRRAALDGGP